MTRVVSKLYDWILLTSICGWDNKGKFLAGK